MKLFDYIKVLFGKDVNCDKVSNYDKSKNSFMTNRFMSIKFPIQANMFNTLKIDPVGQAESWRLISSKFNRVPGFIYTKVKKTPKQKAKEWNPNPAAKETDSSFKASFFKDDDNDSDDMSFIKGGKKQDKIF